MMARFAHHFLLALILVVGVSFSASAAECPANLDLLLRGGEIIDGTGRLAYRADVGIRAGRIAAIGTLHCPAQEVLDISGLTLSPGFIDLHSHADRALWSDETAAMEGILKQGVTTAVFGIDGFMGLEDLKSVIERMDSGRVAINVMSYIGHNSLRAQSVGMVDRHANPAEMAEMQASVRSAMELGALGLSSGLMYLPGRYAPTSELVTLASEVRPFGGRYDSHIRNPTREWVQSVEECLNIGRDAGVHAHVAHLKAVGALNFGKAQTVIDLVNARLAAGQDLSVDLYPYGGAAARPLLSLLLPAGSEEGDALAVRAKDFFEDGLRAASEGDPIIEDLRRYWAGLEQGGSEWQASRALTEGPPEGVFSWIAAVGYPSMRIVVSDDPALVDRMVIDLARERGLAPFELFRQLVVSQSLGVQVTLGAIQEEEVRAIMRQPWAMVASDGAAINVTHPRGWGTFPRLLGRYVREWGVLPLEAAVHKVTGQPAAYLMLADRGEIRVGAIADIAVFDPARIIDEATWKNPDRQAEGLHHLLIGGSFALRDGAPTDARLGRFLWFSGAE